MALALLGLTPLFKGPPKFMVVPHGDTCIVKTGEQRLIQSHQGFVLPQRPLRGGGNAACCGPWRGAGGGVELVGWLEALGLSMAGSGDSRIASAAEMRYADMACTLRSKKPACKSRPALHAK